MNNWGDFNYVLAAVKNEGWAMKHADEYLKKNFDIVLAASFM